MKDIIDWIDETSQSNSVFDTARFNLLKKAIEKNPLSKKLYFDLSSLLLLDHNYEEASKILEIAVDKFEDPALYNRLANCYIRLKRIDEALANFKFSLEIDPENEKGLFGYAQCIADLGNKDKAFEIYKNIISNKKKCDKIIYSKYIQYLLEEGSYENALELSEYCLEDNPNLSFAKAYKSIALAALGKNQISEDNLSANIKTHKLNSIENYNNIDEFNSALTDQIYDSLNLVYEPYNISTRVGSQGTITPKLRTGAFGVLQKIIKRNIDDYISNSNLYNGNFEVKLNMWAVILDGGGHQQAHFHTQEIISGVYYVRLPDSMKNSEKVNDKKGWIEFGEFPSRFNVSQPVKKTIQPEEGLMVLFPSEYYHNTIPTDLDDNGKRICIAFGMVDGERTIMNEF